MKLALGPLQYYWPRDTVFDFYQAMAETPVDVVYLGEAVCSRRRELRQSDWIDIARMLRDAGKQAVLSTMVLLESTSDVSAMHKIAQDEEFLIEANDMGAVHQLAGKRAFVAGPQLNLFNADSLNWMVGLGARRWVMPLEMRQADLAVLQQHKPAGLETEVFAYGRMPLAFSARCFTARHYNLPKDDCRFSCIANPDGLLLKTREQSGFLVLNGTQTQSAKVYNLVDALDDMRTLGVDVVRLSPQSQNMAEVVAVFDAVRKQTLAPQEALARMQPLMPDEGCNGYWHGQPGLDQVASTGQAVAA